MDLLDVITPEELAKHMGWSPRRLRSLARELGACRILGNRMRLTREDVEAILEATKPAPLLPASRLSSGVDGVSAKTLAWLARPYGYEDRLREREREKRKKEAEKRANRMQRARLPRSPRPDQKKKERLPDD